LFFDAWTFANDVPMLRCRADARFRREAESGPAQLMCEASHNCLIFMPNGRQGHLSNFNILIFKNKYAGLLYACSHTGFAGAVCWSGL
jgi:hypothetical protein